MFPVFGVIYNYFRYLNVGTVLASSGLQPAEQAGVVGGGGAVVDRDKPIARLELGEVAAAQAEVDHDDARCVDRAAASRTTKSAQGALLTIITSISC